MAYIRTLGSMGLAVALAASVSIQFAAAQKAGYNPATYKGPDRMKRLIAGAKKEGTVTVYSSMIVDQALRPLLNGFMKKYPFVKAKYLRENPPTQLQKLMAESRANRRVADVVESTGLEVRARAAKLIQPYYSPESAAYDKSRRDPDNYYSPTRFSYIGTCYNTKMVKKADLPKSFDDLLNPKWKGKLAWTSSTVGAVLFITAIRKTMGEKKAEAYLKKLAKQNMVLISSSNRVTVDKVVAGEHAICLDAFLHHPIISARKGAPVASLPLSPVISLVSSVMLPNKPPHPHAAMLFIDYILSVDGQKTLQKANYFPAHPKVDASPHLNQVIPSKIGLKVNFIAPPVMTRELSKSRKIFNRIFVK